MAKPKIHRKDQGSRVRQFGEVFTPPEIAERMLDMLEPATWTDPNIKLCEPAVGHGVFIQAMVRRLMIGLKPIIPDPHARYAHIFEHNIYAVDIQPQCIDFCLNRFGLHDMKHNFVVDNFLTMDIDRWLKK